MFMSDLVRNPEVSFFFAARLNSMRKNKVAFSLELSIVLKASRSSTGDGFKMRTHLIKKFLTVRTERHDLVLLCVLAYVRVFGSHSSPEGVINCY